MIGLRLASKCAGAIGSTRDAEQARRAFGIVGIFGLFGPPIGGIVAWATMGSRTMRSPIPFLLGSYGEGLALALGTGLVVAVAAIWFSKTSWLVPVTAALVASAVPVLMGALTSETMSLASITRGMGVFLPPSLVASVSCWLLSRRLFAQSGH